MFKKITQTITLLTGLLIGQIALAQGLDLTTKTNTLVATLDALGLPVLILAICVGVFGYWFKAFGIAFAGVIVIGGIIFGAAPELAAFLLA